MRMPTSAASSRMSRVLRFLGAGPAEPFDSSGLGAALGRCRGGGPLGGCVGSLCEGKDIGGLMPEDDGRVGLADGGSGPLGGLADEGRAGGRWPLGWNLAPQYWHEVA